MEVEQNQRCLVDLVGVDSHRNLPPHTSARHRIRDVSDAIGKIPRREAAGYGCA